METIANIFMCIIMIMGGLILVGGSGVAALYVWYEFYKLSKGVPQIKRALDKKLKAAKEELGESSDS